LSLQFDRDNDNTIDFGEFLEILRMDEVVVQGRAIAPSEKTLRQLYKMFDRDGDAVVTCEDFDVFIASLKSLVHVADVPHSGEVVSSTGCAL
jgi:Ca2+-binding EF-hand superfamily protein